MRICLNINYVTDYGICRAVLSELKTLQNKNHIMNLCALLYQLSVSLRNTNYLFCLFDKELIISIFKFI